MCEQDCSAVVHTCELSTRQPYIIQEQFNIPAGGVCYKFRTKQNP